MLMRTDPFRELDRLTQQLLTSQGTLARPAAMLMDAWREGDSFVVEFDLPGVSQDSIDIDVERNVVTIGPNARLGPATPNSSRPNVHAGCSAASSFSGTTWTPSTSKPATTAAS